MIGRCDNVTEDVLLRAATASMRHSTPQRANGWRTLTPSSKHPGLSELTVCVRPLTRIPVRDLSHSENGDGGTKFSPSQGQEVGSFTVALVKTRQIWWYPVHSRIQRRERTCSSPVGSKSMLFFPNGKSTTDWTLLRTTTQRPKRTSERRKRERGQMHAMRCLPLPTRDAMSPSKARQPTEKRRHPHQTKPQMKCTHHFYEKQSDATPPRAPESGISFKHVLPRLSHGALPRPRKGRKGENTQTGSPSHWLSWRKAPPNAPFCSPPMEILIVSSGAGWRLTRIVSA